MHGVGCEGLCKAEHTARRYNLGGGHRLITGKVTRAMAII
jgi:hypothetical protein